MEVVVVWFLFTTTDSTDYKILLVVEINLLKFRQYNIRKIVMAVFQT